MKKIGIALLTFLFLWTALYAFLEGPTAHKLLRNQLEKSLKKSGMEVQIGAIEGTLPSHIELRNVQIVAEGSQISIEKVSLRPILWRFLKNEVAFKDIDAKNISASNSKPFDFKGSFWTSRRSATLKGEFLGWKGSVRLQRRTRKISFKAQHAFASLQGSAHLNLSWQPESFDVQFAYQDLQGKLTFTKEGKADLLWNYKDVQGTGHALLKGRHLEGEILAAPYAKATIDWTLLPNLKIEGSNLIDIQNLQSLALPDTYGALQAKLLWKVEEGVQNVQIDGKTQDLYYKKLFARNASFYSDLQLSPLQGFFDLSLEKGSWEDAQIDHANFSTEINGPFTAFFEGKWNHPLELRAEGAWEDFNSIHLETLQGNFSHHPISLLQPADFLWNHGDVLLSPVKISLGNGQIAVSAKQQNILFSLMEAPLDLFSFNSLHAEIDGSLDLEANIEGKNGRFSAKLTQSSPFEAFGDFSGSFDKDKLRIEGDLKVEDRQIARTHMILPIRVMAREILWHGPAQGEIAFDGHIEDLLDFFDLGSHLVTGLLQGELFFGNTLYRPLVEGYLLIEDGEYENYSTGTKLHDIHADFLAEKNQIYLRSLSARGEEDDTLLTAKGQIKLLQKDAYPFSFDVNFTDLPFAQIDLVTASGDGQIHIEGNLHSALATGRMELTECALQIPKHIPSMPPKLEVAYINPVHPVIPAKTDLPAYPLFLDLSVEVPSLTINGRGLDSEWEGNFHVGGSAGSIATKGDLELIEGEFLFSNREFSLTKGTLSFSGVEHEMPKLHLEGTTEVKDTSIIAELNGFLDNPKLSLRSSPALPLSSIMARLLFGQDVSEISGYQALELANSVAELNGAGPGVMESTRRALGVDRLRIVADGKDGERVAIQVGKYVTDNVLVSLTQGVDESEPNISIEVSLKGNITLQLENDQHQEQGKFTLKWHTNY